MSDLHEYFAEIDLAWWRITERDGHREVIVSAHSTGGLTVPLWAHERRHPELVAMVLNSPWFDMQGAAWLRSPATRLAIERLGTTRPKREIPRKISEVYGRSLHVEHGGEWDYDLAWKPLESRPVYVGWLRAVRRGHAQLHAGLDVPCPTLVLSSARSFFGEQTEETAVDPRHRARRRADPPLGLVGRPARHLDRDRGRDARRGPLPARRPRAGVRRPRHLAGGVGGGAGAREVAGLAPFRPAVRGVRNSRWHGLDHRSRLVT